MSVGRCCDCMEHDHDERIAALEERFSRLERIVARLAINTGTTVPEIEKLLDLIDKGEG